MKRFTSATIPVFAIVSTCAATLASIAGGGGVAVNECDGYCSSQTLACAAPNMRCCCKVEGVWTCQCKLPTDCNAAHGCQDGGAS